MDRMIDSAYALVVRSKGGEVCSDGLRMTRWVIVSLVFVSRCSRYLYKLGDQLLWNRDMYIGERERGGKVTA
jgi:hypothetical protein